MHKARFYILNLFFFIVVSYFPKFAFAQSDSTQEVSHFSGKIFATHNGISLIPSFSLNRPALLFNLALGKKKLTFEPDIRFALEGKPWSFLFWWRYKAIQKEKYSLRIGAHPALNFRTIPVVSNGKEKDVIESRRFIAAELAQSFTIAKNFNVGTYYLYSYGFDDSQKHGHFVVLNSAITNIGVYKDFNFHMFPNIYYLRLDDLEGYYVSSTFQLTKKDFPFSLEAILNQSIKTEILPEQTFVWNISLVYSFNKNYVDATPKI